MTTIKFAKVKSNAIVPTKGSLKSAGYDLYACIDYAIAVPPHSTVKVGTGIAIQPPEGYFGAIFARSGLATKFGMRPSNCVGVCDEDYTGEYIVAIHNDTDEYQSVKPYERVAQLVFLPYLNCEFEEVEVLDETERGNNGFGSTGR
jgi:dUTP pyrophosphatase